MAKLAFIGAGRMAGAMVRGLLRSKACAPADIAVLGGTVEAAALDAGASLIVFPEGTRSPDGKIQPFKSGLHHLARARPTTPLVPIFLDNLNRILPKGDFLPVPLVATLAVGAPLAFDARDSGDVTWAPEFDNYQLRTAVNIPLSGVDSELLNARFVFTREVGDGTTRNPAGTEREGFGSKNDWYTRLSLRSKPSDNLTIDLRGW